MSTARKAILKAMIEGALVEIFVKTSGEQVYLTDGTTVAAKIAEMVTAINARAKTEDMTSAINSAVAALKTELMGEGVPEYLNTFKEVAEALEENEEVAAALQAAIGNKADKTTVEAIQKTISALGSLASKSAVSESDLDSALKAKVNAAAEGNHSHENKSVLDEITDEKVVAWNAKAKVYKSDIQPQNMTDNDLWIHLV